MSVFNLGTIDKSSEEGNANPEAPMTSEVTTVNVANTEQAVEGEKKEPTIVLDGPLSSIYTQALNLVYSKESGMTQVHAMIGGLDEEEELNTSDTSLYVYCVDGDKIDSNELNTAIDKLRIALDNKKYSKVVLAVECGTNIGSKIALLDQFSKDIGVKVCFSRKKALEHISCVLKV